MIVGWSVVANRSLGAVVVCRRRCRRCRRRLNEWSCEVVACLRSAVTRFCGGRPRLAWQLPVLTSTRTSPPQASKQIPPICTCNHLSIETPMIGLSFRCVVGRVSCSSFLVCFLPSFCLPSFLSFFLSLSLLLFVWCRRRCLAGGTIRVCTLHTPRLFL